MSIQDKIVEKFAEHFNSPKWSDYYEFYRNIISFDENMVIVIEAEPEEYEDLYDKICKL